MDLGGQLHHHHLKDRTHDAEQNDNREHGSNHHRELHDAVRMQMRIAGMNWPRALMTVAALCLATNVALAADKYRVQELKLSSDAGVSPHALNSNGDAVGGAGLSHG